MISKHITQTRLDINISLVNHQQQQEGRKTKLSNFKFFIKYSIKISFLIQTIMVRNRLTLDQKLFKSITNTKDG